MKQNKIKKLREQLMIDQKEFGDLIGVSRTTVSDWENDKAKPSFSNMRKLKDLELSIKKK